LLAKGRGPAGFGNATWNGLGGISSSKASTAAEGLGGAGDGVNLAVGYAENSALPLGSYTAFAGQAVGSSSILVKFTCGADADLDGVVGNSDVTIRSEEHTSELQSLAYLVCRLLLEKKK